MHHISYDNALDSLTECAERKGRKQEGKRQGRGEGFYRAACNADAVL